MEFGKLSQQLTKEIETLISKFDAPVGHITNLEIISNGRINRSFKVTLFNEGGFHSYILQCVNVSVFRNPKVLMDNIYYVTSHIASKGKETLNFKAVRPQFVSEKYGGYIYHNGSECWRISDFVESDVKNQIEMESDVFSLGEAIGNFAEDLADFDASRLKETIEDFHNTPVRLARLINRIVSASFADDAFLQLRAKECMEEINFLLEQKRLAKVSIITDAIKLKAIPMRVSHNDPKLNNVLFDKLSGKVKCLIDLDTVMPGTILYDFGDAVRYACNTEPEESLAPENVRINLDYFKAFCEGFISSSNISESEADLLVDSAWMMTYELAIRFFDDHLDLNKYFGVNHDGQNLERAKIQMALLEDIEKNYDKMQEIVSEIYFEKG